MAMLSIKFYFKRTHIVEHKIRVKREFLFLRRCSSDFCVFCSQVFGFFYDLFVSDLMYACNLVIDVKLIERW